MATGLAAVEHVVVLMLENRSFDHMLGYLYSGQGNSSPRGDAFDGLTGAEACPDAAGNPVPVVPITPTTPNVYLMPGADPGAGSLRPTRSCSARSDRRPGRCRPIRASSPTTTWRSPPIGHAAGTSRRARLPRTS